MLNKDLETIRIWSLQNGLNINSTKTTVISIGIEYQRNQVTINNKLFINGFSVQFQNTCKILGIRY